MRKPTIHKQFSVTSSVGLSNVLVDQALIDEACQTTEVEGLFVLTSGAVPPNPNELVGSKKFKEVLEKLKEAFDCIIIDTPPVGIVSDALLLSSEADGIIFVTRFDFSRKEQARQAVERLKMTSTPVIGAVLNGMTKSRNSYYYYRYK